MQQALNKKAGMELLGYERQAGSGGAGQPRAAGAWEKVIRQPARAQHGRAASEAEGSCSLGSRPWETSKRTWGQRKEGNKTGLDFSREH